MDEAADSAAFNASSKQVALLEGEYASEERLVKKYWYGTHRLIEVQGDG